MQINDCRLQHILNHTYKELSTYELGEQCIYVIHFCNFITFTTERIASHS